MGNPIWLAVHWMADGRINAASAPSIPSATTHIFLFWNILQVIANPVTPRATSPLYYPSHH